MRQLSEALLHAYPHREGLEQVLEFDLERSLNQLVGNASTTDTVFAVLIAARSQGWLDDFVDAVLADRPGNPLLKRWAAEIEWQPKPAQEPVPDNFERTIRAHAPEIQPGPWRKKLAQLENRTCRIDAETSGGYVPFGTGFLIGQGRVVKGLPVSATLVWWIWVYRERGLR
jgi:hypothetical protein